MLDDQERLAQMAGRKAFVAEANMALELLEMLLRDQDFLIENPFTPRMR